MVARCASRTASAASGASFPSHSVLHRPRAQRRYRLPPAL